MEKRLKSGHSPCCSVLWVCPSFHEIGTLPLPHEEKAEFTYESFLAEGEPEKQGGREPIERYDELYARAIIIVLMEGRGSVSMLQRFLGIGYGRAARLIDFMFEDGIVGPHNGTNARDVLFQPKQ